MNKIKKTGRKVSTTTDKTPGDGIGGRTNLLNKVGILRIKQPQDNYCDLQCYVFNEVIGQTEEMLLV